MPSSRVLVIGSGHLAHRARDLLARRGFELLAFPVASADDVAAMAAQSRALEAVDLAAVTMVFLLDDRDEINLNLLLLVVSLNKRVPVTAALSNENIAPHLRAAHPHVRLVNPAKIAAPVFLAALDAPLTRAVRYAPAPVASEPAPRRVDRLVGILVAAFAVVAGGATAYFHFNDGMSALDALYFVVVTISTVGYGDISLLNAHPMSKVIDIMLIIASTAFIWLIFSLTVDAIIKKRVQLALGRRRYTYKNHIILCGLGRLGSFVADGLLDQGARLLVIEKNENAPTLDYFRRRGASIYIGDARVPRVLQDAGVGRAKALFSVINDDYGNLEISLNARSFNPELRIIVRIFDEALAGRMREELDIQLAFSMSAIADDYVIAGVTPAADAASRAAPAPA